MALNDTAVTYVGHEEVEQEHMTDDVVNARHEEMTLGHEQDGSRNEASPLVDDEVNASSSENRKVDIKQTNRFEHVNEHGQNANVGTQLLRSDQVRIDNVRIINVYTSNNTSSSADRVDTEPAIGHSSFLGKPQTISTGTTSPATEQKSSIFTQAQTNTNTIPSEALDPNCGVKSSTNRGSSLRPQSSLEASSRGTSYGHDTARPEGCRDLSVDLPQGRNFQSPRELAHMGRWVTTGDGDGEQPPPQEIQTSDEATESPTRAEAPQSTEIPQSTEARRAPETPDSTKTLDTETLQSTENPKSLSRRFINVLKSKKNKARDHGKNAKNSVVETLKVSMSFSIGWIINGNFSLEKTSKRHNKNRRKNKSRRPPPG